MKHILLTLLLASSAFAADLEVPVGTRAALKSRKAISEITVRDPSMLSVVVADGSAAFVGKKSGVTAVTVEYADGELERRLVVVGDGLNDSGMTAERAKTQKL